MLGQKKNLDPKKFGSKIIWVQKNFRLKRSFGPKRCLVEKIMCQKNFGENCFGVHHILSPKNIGPNNILGPKSFGSQDIFFCKKILGPKEFFGQINLSPKNCGSKKRLGCVQRYWDKKVSSKKHFASKIISRQALVKIS